MADKSTELILDALNTAVLEPEGTPLHGGKSVASLFPTNAAAKQAAERCKEEGLLRVVRTETKGKSVQEICAITEKGLAYLLDEAKPKHLLEDFLRALEARQEQLDDMVTGVRNAQASLESLKTVTEKILQKIAAERVPTIPEVGQAPTGNGSHCWKTDMMQHLAQWRASGTSDDCPLPRLFAQLKQTTPTLTLGDFHDEVRRLHQQGKIYLHPWTGPLYEMPEPACALLIGHEILYYTSLR